MSRKNIFYKLLELFSAVLAIILVMIPVIGIAVMFLNSPVLESGRFSFEESDGVRRRDDGAYYFEIKRGETAQSVGKRLENAGLIRSRYFWNVLGRFEKEFIKSGTYKLDMPLSQIAIYRLFVSGRQTLHRVTIPEGTTISKIGHIYEYEDICSQQDFIQAARNRDILDEYSITGNTAEGYLFPDTYFFPSQYDAEEVVRTMLDNFFKRIKAIDPSIDELTSKQLNEKVIIASIVEREYRIPEEAGIMAGVFYNRLSINMGLQSCATVEYIITEIMGQPHPGFITGENLEIDNRYNTYKWSGLPPGPISSPGELSLRAALFPELTEYFYFRLSDADTGRHIFTRTNEEHIQAGRYRTKPESR